MLICTHWLPACQVHKCSRIQTGSRRLLGGWWALKIFQSATNHGCQCGWHDMISHASQPAAGYVGDMLMLTGIWGGKEPQLFLYWNAGLKDVWGPDHEQYSAARPLVHIKTPDVSVTRGFWAEEERDTDWELEKERWRGGSCSNGNKEMAFEGRITLNLPPKGVNAEDSCLCGSHRCAIFGCVSFLKIKGCCWLAMRTIWTMFMLIPLHICMCESLMNRDRSCRTSILYSVYCLPPQLLSGFIW